MGLGMVLMPLTLAWVVLSAILCLSVCVVAGRVSRAEEWESYVDWTAAQLLAEVDLDL